MEPLDAYFYRIKISLIGDNKMINTYKEEFRIRSVHFINNKFLINNKPFYFKRFGKYEDSYVNGCSLNETVNIKDFNLVK